MVSQVVREGLVLDERPRVVDHDVFVVHADDDTPFIKGELLPMLNLPEDRVILSSELPTTDTTEAAVSAKQVIPNEAGSSSIAMQSVVHLERTTKGDALSIASTGWRETAPGVWESSAQESGSRIVIGAQGHQFAIAQAEKDLSALHDRAALRAGGDPAIASAIRQQEAQLKNLQDAAQALAQTPGPVTQAVSCNIGFLNGPSSPLTGFFGALAGSQISCTGGCQTFTVQALACTNFGCTPTVTGSNFVCATPWLFGVAQSGSFGASCAAQTTVTPPGITATSFFPCG